MDDRYLYRRDGSCGFLFQRKREELIHLNETATFIFERVIAGENVDTIIAATAEHFDLHDLKFDLKTDFERFLLFLFDQEIISRELLEKYRLSTCQ